ncbi:MAG: hypothetical protein JWL59_3767 [Chthoniobacteraceae bacterium]|nr:hypothetical protein [Chthoniobacteraceae bacterium]
MPPFLNLLRAGLEHGGFETDDVLRIVLPLLRQVQVTHDDGKVAPLRGLDSITLSENGTFQFDPEKAKEPSDQKARVEAVQNPVTTALQIVGQARVTTEVGAGSATITNLEVGQDEGAGMTHPIFLTGYVAWEQMLQHHDALTDIFSLGMLIASLACGLDFTDPDDLNLFASNRNDLFKLNSRLHPVLAAVITEMTELNRHRRSPDLPTLIQRLENYRDQPVNVDLRQLPGFADSGVPGRRKVIQSHLRDRLFEISRRNRLVYFRPTLQTLNLTVASVPMVLDLRSVRLEQLFVWHPALASEIVEGKPMALGKYLRFEDQPYLPGVLDKLIAEARRDRAEFGFAQLRLVLCFLHWHNLKESPEERIISPLLLMPVELSRKKGVRDQYVLLPGTSEAEVNPALRHHLRQVYNLQLPETVDLRETSMEAFHEQLKAQIQASEPGVTLNRIDKPQIELIHERAKQRLDQFRRRQKLKDAGKQPHERFDYSYERENLKPLGLQIFQQKIKPSPLPHRETAGALPKPRLPQIVAAPGRETGRDAFALKSGSGANRYVWDFDLCSMTLGNFNYRKMTLVRDYARLIDSDMASEAFDRTFSLDPKSLADDEAVQGVVPIEDQWLVVPSDATQASAIAKARTGASYIIQGPPGTGKSQTITNLIADFVARGKRVLFVCEKRAAIDVVYYRLKQQGLDELCCLIHDSQTDKKAFIQNLRRTYEGWLSGQDDGEMARDRRMATVQAIERELDGLERFSNAMVTVPSPTGITVRRLFDRLLELRAHETALDARTAEHLPDYALWLRHGALAHRLAAALGELNHEPMFAAHSFRWLAEAVIRAERPLETLESGIAHARKLIEELEQALTDSGLPEEQWDVLEKIGTLLEFARRIEPLAARHQLTLLDPASPLAHSFAELTREIETRTRLVTLAKEKTIGWGDWKTTIPPGDVPAALAQARAMETSFWRFFQPAWWKLKKTIERAYDFSRHAIRPLFSQILSELAAELEAEASLAALNDEIRAKFDSTLPVQLAAELAELQRPADPVAKAFRQLLLQSADADETVVRLANLAPRYEELHEALSEVVHDYGKHGFAALGQALTDLDEASGDLPDLLPVLSELIEAPAAFSHALRQLFLTPDQIEAAAARRSLDAFYRSERWLSRCDGRVISQHMDRAASLQNDYFSHNATVLRAEVRRRFRENVQISSQPAGGLTPEEKLFKKGYTAGRRALEHEFGKSMRYKSIRELAAGESGQVVWDLKPIWLMSPLSVSDTLPLETNAFDVVIFDEASQVPVEEAVPALYRAAQVIVVGDEMQLPPTTFFAGARGADEESVEVEEAGEQISIPLDADSFLTQSARNLPSTLLAWHYRSRSEALISFSNAAFYAGNLFTIPDRHIAVDLQETPPALPATPAVQGADQLLAKSISFHRMERGVYEQRRNAVEAAYIAELVRELLRRNTELSLGIVAFSEAQQGEIESALETLAGEDTEFGALLEAEMVREKDEQFCGLFIKNLENVQGDERDIIVLSICYAPAKDGRMLMNFGPINQRGGEKRLNVIFSRAKHHMAVISSIGYEAITNDFNDGAHALKNYLQYAEATSRGDRANAQLLLESLNPLSRKTLNSGIATRDTVIEQLAAALRARGHTVALHVGQSRFRCDMAVSKPGGTEYLLGIFIDSKAHYSNPDILERYITQPSILRAFGWKTTLILGRDWFFEPEAVLERIDRLLQAG